MHDGLSGLVAGTAYGSDASGVITASQAANIGYAVSATELVLRPRYGATALPGAAAAYWIFDGGADQVVNKSTSFTTVTDATDFGTMTSTDLYSMGAAASTTRILNAGGYSASNFISYLDVNSATSGFDFSDLTVGRWGASGSGSTTRALWSGGKIGSTSQNVVDYVTIASAGVNAVDFGDLTVAREFPAAYGSTTRGIAAGGASGGGGTAQDVVDYVSWSSTGNSVDFGNLYTARGNFSGASNSTRGINCAGQTGSGAGFATAITGYLTIASLGDSVDFGSLTADHRLGGSAASTTHVLTAGGMNDASANVSLIEGATIASVGSWGAIGDLDGTNNYTCAGCSTGHGGL